MKKYLGVKIIQAELMSEFDFRRSKGMTPSDQETDREGYKVVYEDGYTSWSPKNVFEKAYKSILNAPDLISVIVDTTTGVWSPRAILSTGINLIFGQAVEALKCGKKVARTGWNGKGMWLRFIDYQPCNQAGFNEYGDEIKVYDELDSKIELLPWIGMKTADEKFVPWLASQTDILAEDWQIVE